jgi:aldehyde dehydrogenase (NAD+)
MDEVLERIHDGPKPLAFYIMSEDRTVVEKALNGASAGGSVVNGTLLHCANPRLPFGGVGMSGLGHYHGEYSFRCFSHERSIVHQGRLARLLPLPHAPYSALSRPTRWFIRHATDIDPGKE